MVTFNFVIDRDMCFAYWAQCLIKWGTYFYQKEFDFYSVFPYPLTTGEQSALDSLMEILQKKDNGYAWLWKRYKGLPVQDAEEAASWKLIQDGLRERFDKVWEVEFPFLVEWQKLITTYSQNHSSDIFFSRVADFFGIHKDTLLNVEVKLFFRSQADVPSGHTKREYDDLLLLGVSRVNHAAADKVFSVVLHETSHILENKSPTFWPLIKDAYSRVLHDRAIGVDMGGRSWRSLMTESVITSMAGSAFKLNYWNRLYLGLSGMPDRSVVAPFDYVKIKNNYGAQIIAVASHIVDMTTRYFNDEKQVDQEYADAVAIAWLGLVSRSLSKM